MCRRQIYSVFLVLALGLGANLAKADIESGLVGYWPLDGDATDASGTGLHGTINGNVVPTTDRFGYADSAMLFPGATNSYIELGDPAELQITGAMTLAAWVRIDSYETNGRIIARIGSTRSYSLNVEGEQYGHVGAFQVAAAGDDLRIVTTADRIDFGPDEWFHIAGTFEPSVAMKIYINGELDNTLTDNIPDTQFIANTVRIGKSGYTWGQFPGSIDEVRVYDRALSADDIYELGTTLIATSPDPPDGAEDVTSPLLQWKPGATAAFHDVYVGTTPDLGPEDFQTQNSKVLMMYWHQPGLSSNTTYYWRIDEVEADAVTVHTGDVWSFSTPPLAAYDPDPPDGAEFVPTEADLSWTAGYEAFSHDVYFGTDETAVADGTGDTFKGNVQDPPYDPGPLAKDTTYYWRVDEVQSDLTTKHPGPVWSFTTVPDMPITDPNLIGWWKLDEGAGRTALDSSGHDHHGTFTGDPQWVAGYDGGALEFDGQGDDRVSCGTFDVEGSGIAIACWFKADNLDTPGNDPRMVSKATGGASNDHWFMISSSRLGSPERKVLRFRLKTDGQTGELKADYDTGTIELNEWIHVVATWDGSMMRIYKNGLEVGSLDKTGTLSTGPTVKVAIGNQPEGAEDRPFDGIIDDVRIYNKPLTAADIPDIMRGDTSLAWDPSPADGSVTDVERAAVLSWKAGDKAAQHDVYFGTDRTAVRTADTSDTTGVYRQRQGATSYMVPEVLEWDQTYYWRIDEYNIDTTISTGRVWSFTVADYLIVDDFEDYNDYTPDRVWQTWLDGAGYSEPPPGYGGNGTGSQVGNDEPPFTEQITVHSGLQAMTFRYTNDGSGGKALYSEAQREWSIPQDWTRKGVKALTLWFHGDSANSAEPLYVGVQDSLGTRKDIPHENISAVMLNSWHEWNIDLQEFANAGVNLTSVKKLILGVGNRLSPQTGGTGTLYFDDIRLYRPRCMPLLAKPDADFNGNCVVDDPDLQILTDEWLGSGYLVTPQQPSNAGLVAHYAFENNTQDGSGNGHHGTTQGATAYVPSRPGQGTAMQFDNQGGVMQAGAFDVVGPGITLAAWLRPDDFDVGDARIISKAFGSGGNEHFWMLSTISSGGEIRLRFRLKTEDGQDTATLVAGSGALAATQWAHAAATWDGSRMRLYKDGQEVGNMAKGGAAVATDPVVSVAIGNQPPGAIGGTRNYDGLIDDVRIYSRALPGEQILWLAGITAPFSEPFDLNVDGVVDFRDYAILADAWLDTVLWP